MAEHSLLVRKSDGQVEGFRREQIARGIRKAMVHRHREDVIEELVQAVIESIHRRRKATEPIGSQDIGDAVMEELKPRDAVSHVRYALVFVGGQSQPHRQSGWANARDFRGWLRVEYPELPEMKRPDTVLREIVKRDGRRQAFDRKKLERSIGIASKGRGRSDSEVDRFATNVAEEVYDSLCDQPIVTTGQLAAEILRVLRTLDDIAYLRYAGTAKQFSDVQDYELEAVALELRRAVASSSGLPDQDVNRAVPPAIPANGDA